MTYLCRHLDRGWDLLASELTHAQPAWQDFAKFAKNDVFKRRRSVLVLLSSATWLERKP